jgi:outer membrane protein OmpA-like peptidoglycan-associated protein
LRGDGGEGSTPPLNAKRYHDGMRRLSPPVIAALLTLVALLVHGPSLADTPAGGTGQDAPAKKPALVVSIDRSKVDLAGHSLEVKLSRAADKVALKAVGQSGAVLAEVEKSFGGAAPGTVLVMTWTPSSDEPIAKIEVWGYDTDGYYAGVAIIPWSLSVPHEEVNFETDSDVIRPTEVPKLEASFQKIKEAVAAHGDLGKITLFVVGHTDTVGTVDHNLTLSRRRARTIATWFKGRGITLPIAYEGMGKSVLLVKTADQVDEPRNRRVDYILALEPPRIGGADVAWKVP